jgi:hypothetical protein
MMKNEEREAVLAAAEQLARFSTALRARGLTFSEPEIQVWNESPPSYTSELRAKIYHNGVLDDSLEFHVYRDGRQLVTKDEVARWFEEQLRALVA